MLSSLWQAKYAPGLAESISQNPSVSNKSFERSKNVYIRGNQTQPYPHYWVKHERIQLNMLNGITISRISTSIIEHDRKNAATHNDYILKKAELVFTY